MSSTIEGAPVIDLDAALSKMKSLESLSKRYEIKKARLKEDNFLNVSYSENLDDSTNTVSKDCSAVVHNDLKEAFSRLDGLLLKFTEQPEDSKITCTGFTIGKDGDGATLIGLRELDNGKVLNLTSPYERFDDEPVLENVLTTAKQEVLQYLFMAKHAPDQQLSMFEDDEDGDFVEEEL